MENKPKFRPNPKFKLMDQVREVLCYQNNRGHRLFYHMTTQKIPNFNRKTWDVPYYYGLEDFPHPVPRLSKHEYNFDA